MFLQSSCSDYGFGKGRASLYVRDFLLKDNFVRRPTIKPPNICAMHECQQCESCSTGQNEQTKIRLRALPIPRQFEGAGFGQTKVPSAERLCENSGRDPLSSRSFWSLEEKTIQRDERTPISSVFGRNYAIPRVFTQPLRKV